MEIKGDNMQNTYTAFASRETELTATMERIAKIAKRLNVEAPRMEITARYTKTFTPLNGKKFQVGAIDYIIVGASPKLEGNWQVLAAADHLAEGIIVRMNPTVETTVEVISNVCEHCGTNRDRKTTVTLQDENGKRIQVGKSCVKDFVGHNLPAVWDIWQELETFQSDNFSGSRASFAVAQILPIAFRVVELDGYESQITANKVHSILTNKDSKTAEKYIPTEQNIVDAEAAHTWITNIQPSNDYENNLKVAVLAESTEKHFNFIVSLTVAYTKHIQRETFKAEVNEIPEAPAPLGKHTITGRVLTAYVKDTEWGSREVMTVLDDRGFKVWGSVPSSISGVTVGSRITFTATIEEGKEPSFGFFKRPSKAEVIG